MSSQENDLWRVSVVQGGGKVRILLYQAQHCRGLQTEPPAGHCERRDGRVPQEGMLALLWFLKERPVIGELGSQAQTVSCPSLPCCLPWLIAFSVPSGCSNKGFFHLHLPKSSLPWASWFTPFSEIPLIPSPPLYSFLSAPPQPVSSP